MRDEERAAQQGDLETPTADSGAAQAERRTVDEELPPSPARAAADAGGVRRGGPSSGLYGTRERVLRRERALQHERAMREQWPPAGGGRSAPDPGTDALPDDAQDTAAAPGQAGPGPATAGTDRRDVEAAAQDEGPARELSGREVPGREQAAAEDLAGDAAPAAYGTDDRSAVPGTPGAGAVPGTGSRLIPQEESDRLNGRLREALAGFVDEPRSAVEQAAEVLEETAERLRRVLAERPRALRSAWDGRRPADRADGAARADGAGADGSVPDRAGSDTEELRLALRTYREVTERLLRV